MKSFEKGEYPQDGEVVRLYQGQTPLCFFGFSNVVVFIKQINASSILIQSHDSIKETNTTEIKDLYWEPHYEESKQPCHSASTEWHDC